MFKRLFASTVCVLMLLTTVFVGTSVSAQKADTAAFSLSVSEGGVGDTVTVSLSITENSYFTNAMIYLHYDSSLVSYVEDSLAPGAASPKAGTMFDAMAHPDNNFVKCAYITASVVKKGGVLLTFDFEVLSDAPAAFSLSFDECDAETEDGTMVPLSYTIKGCTLNDDGSLAKPTGGPVVTTPVATTTTASQPSASETTTSVVTTTPTLPTINVTDANNSTIAVPVVTTTDANGSSATVPVTIVTNAQGTTVMVPVEIVTNPQGEVELVPETQTNAQGSAVTVTVTTQMPTSGEAVTTQVPAVTTQPTALNPDNTTKNTAASEEEGGNNGLVVILLVVFCVIAVVIVSVVAVRMRKKDNT